ncbi:MAG: ABC transporter permease [Candidatus Hydrogenedentes bacterium]|nr:ABC transporter permease [Candidatus Hydrogenedentota bacterium]
MTHKINRRTRLSFLGDYLGLLGVLALLVVLFSLTTQHFFSLIPFRAIANQIPDAVIIASGMTLVLIIAGIDLSVGSLLALSAAVLGVAMVNWQQPLVVALLLALATGLGAGLLNGLVIVRWRLPSFIVTLGMLEAARGAAYLATDSKTQYIGSQIEAVAEANILGLGLPFAVALVTVLALQVLLTQTLFGRHLFALGGNEESARLSGVRVERVRVAVFTLAGGLSGLAAIIHCARLGAADPNAGIGYELNAIAAVVIGGTSLMGGRGSVVRTLLGVLIIAVLESGLAQAGAGESTKRLVTGGVIVAAVIMDYYRNRERL